MCEVVAKTEGGNLMDFQLYCIFHASRDREGDKISIFVYREIEKYLY